MSKKDTVTKSPVLDQQPVPPAPPIVAPPLTKSYGVTGSSTPVTNRALALLNLRSVKN